MAGLNGKDPMLAFTGYQAEMKEFMDSNPGMDRRLVNRAHQDDQSTKDLVTILKGIADKEKTIVEEAVYKLLPKVIDAKKQEMEGKYKEAEAALVKLQGNHASFAELDAAKNAINSSKFSNAGWIVNLMKAYRTHARKTRGSNERGQLTITVDDVKAVGIYPEKSTTKKSDATSKDADAKAE
jgi:hypothetical protein